MVIVLFEVEVPMLKKRWIATFFALVILVAGWFAGVQLALAESGEQLADKYATLAGSEFNAQLLGDVLRAEKAERHERHERMARNERPDKPEKPEHHGR